MAAAVQSTSRTVNNEVKSVLKEAVPEEVADIIIGDKIEMELQDTMKEGRKCVAALVDYYGRLKALNPYPGDWDINTLEDFCPMVSDLSGFSQFINEAWFKEHHMTLFNKMLKDIQESSGEYAKGCIIRTGTISEGQRKFIDSVNEHLLKPLTQMREAAGVRRPYPPGHLSSRNW